MPTSISAYFLFPNLPTSLTHPYPSRFDLGMIFFKEASTTPSTDKIKVVCAFTELLLLTSLMHTLCECLHISLGTRQGIETHLLSPNQGLKYITY